jgi:lipid II:glycine glycyltransferase (peptidoglycan interpeptide bridge formation enzyme)
MGDRPKTVLARQLSEEDAEAFDAFVRASPFAACQQTRAWAGNAPRSRRHDYLHFLCRDGAGEPIGAAIVRRSRLAPGASLATLQRGPVIGEPPHFETVLDKLKEVLRAAGFCSLVLAPRAAGEAREPFVPALARCGFHPLPAGSQALHSVTGKVSLLGSEEEILPRFKQRGRRAIRKVAASGVTVRRASDADLPACAELLTAFHARRPGYDSAGQLGVAAQARLIASEGGALLVAEQDGRIVGWHSFVRQGRSAFWLGLATDDDAQAPRSYLLLWEAMRAARALGLESYDLAGLAADGEETGRDQFKQAFAPEREELLPAHVAALRPLRHAIFFRARQAYRSWRQRRRGL